MTSLEDGNDSTTIAIEPAVKQSSDSNEPLNLFTDETIENLTNGFLEILQPEVTRVQKSLEELICNQEEMLGSIQEKRLQFEDSAKLQEIQSMLQQVPLYKQKLSTATKNMTAIDKRVKRLQARADKLKELRILKENQMKIEFEQKIKEEKMLEAKPSK